MHSRRSTAATPSFKLIFIVVLKQLFLDLTESIENNTKIYDIKLIPIDTL